MFKWQDFFSFDTTIQKNFRLAETNLDLPHHASGPHMESCDSSHKWQSRFSSDTISNHLIHTFIQVIRRLQLQKFRLLSQDYIIIIKKSVNLKNYEHTCLFLVQTRNLMGYNITYTDQQISDPEKFWAYKLLPGSSQKDYFGKQNY